MAFLVRMSQDLDAQERFDSPLRHFWVRSKHESTPRGDILRVQLKQKNRYRRDQNVE